MAGINSKGELAQKFGQASSALLGLAGLGLSAYQAYNNVNPVESISPYLGDISSAVGAMQLPVFTPEDVILQNLAATSFLPGAKTGLDLYERADLGLYATSALSGFEAGSGFANTFTSANDMGTSYLKNGSGYNSATGKTWGSEGQALKGTYGAAYGGYQKSPRMFAGGGWALDNGSMINDASGLFMGALNVGLTAAADARNARLADARANRLNATEAWARANINQNTQRNADNAALAMFNNSALRSMGFGGYTTTNGADFPLNGGFNFIGAGGTHEQNPYDGVPQGIAPDGKLNLVEENEVVWNDYVFSHRLTIPKDFAKKYKLKEGITFAEAAKKLSKEMQERPNDPISNRGVEVSLGELRGIQEDERAKMQARKFKREINKMSPEELMELQLLIAQSQQALLLMPLQPLMLGMQGMLQMPEGIPEQQMLSAFGGQTNSIFDNGGYLGQHIFDGTSNGNTTTTPKKSWKERQAEKKVAREAKRKAKEEAEKLAKSKKIAEQSGRRAKRLLDTVGAGKLGRDRLLEIATGRDGFNAGNFGTTDNTPLVDFILKSYAGETAYEDILKKIADSQVLNILENDPEYAYKNIDATDWGSLLNIMNRYHESKKKGNTLYKYNDDENFQYNGMNVAELEADPEYRKFTDYVLSEGDKSNADVLQYLKMLDSGINTENGTELLFDSNGKLKSNWKDLYKHRRTDSIGGIYHFFQNLKNKKEGERTIYRKDGQKVVVDDPAKLSKFLDETGRSDEFILDEEGNPVTTHYIDLAGNEFEAELPPDVPEDIDIPLPTWMLYASILGGLRGAALNQKHDYTTGVSPILPSREPIGNYEERKLVDTQRYLNAKNQQYNAALNAIMNASGANKNTAMALLALSHMGDLADYSKIMESAENINFGRDHQVNDFNRGTNLFNSTQYGDMQKLYEAINREMMSQGLHNAEMAHIADLEYDAAKSANLTAFYEGLSNLGRQNFFMNQANANPALRFNTNTLGMVDYTGGGLPVVPQNNGTKDAQKALGGSYLTIHRRRRH